ncbi:MAG TPA: hypothetical protein VGM25_10520 [Caulobacteraceae bacterium]|jgi:hypothetical protein
MFKDAGPGGGQAGHLAVAAILIAVMFVAMSLIGPLLAPGGPDHAKLPPLVQVLMAR